MFQERPNLNAGPSSCLSGRVNRAQPARSRLLPAVCLLREGTVQQRRRTRRPWPPQVTLGFLPGGDAGLHHRRGVQGRTPLCRRVLASDWFIWLPP